MKHVKRKYSIDIIKMEPKVEAAKNLLCMACLCVERTLRVLSEGKFKQYYLDCINEIPFFIMPKVLNVCWECDIMLRKAVDFREQVKDSYRILQTYTSENLTECLLTDVSRPPRLKMCVNSLISIIPFDVKEKQYIEEVELNPKMENINVGVTRSTFEMTSSKKDLSPIYRREETFVDQKTQDLLTEESQNSNHNEMKNDLKEELKMEFDIRDPVDFTATRDNPNSRSDIDIDSEVKKFLYTKKMKKRKAVPKSAMKKGKKITKKKSQQLSIEGSQNLDSNEMDNNKKEVALDIKGELKMEFDIRVPEGFDATRDDPSSGSDMDAVSDVKNILDPKKMKKSKAALKDAVKKGKKITKLKKPITKQEVKRILTVNLSYEEVMAEREKESIRDVYTKAAYKCESCIIGFNTAKAYNAHLEGKHNTDIGENRCPICSTIVSTEDSLTEHCKRHFRRYQCAICLKRTMDKKTIEQHYFSTHEISLKEYRCNLCGKVSNSVDSHRYHRDTHKARVQCPDCDKTFSHRAGLMNHRLAVHELHNTFPCTVCEKVFRWRTSLKRHLEKHDLKTKGGTASSAEAFCATCGIEFSSLCSYRRHLRNSLKHVTRDQLKFICDHCNKRFADKTKLRDHIEEKHLHKIYHCQICNKATKNRVGLDQHVRYVHRGRPNSKMCHYCGKGFPTKVQLESHIRTHTGERPFICEYCPTTFSQKSNLYKHNRQVHMNIKSKRHSICKKRREEKKQPDSAIENNQEDGKHSDARMNYQEQMFGAKIRTPEFIVGW